MNTQKANAALGLELVRALREGDGSMPEADYELNRASRAVVHAMYENGEAWLGNINPRPDVSAAWIWRHDGGAVYNFGADFVLPRYDEKLDTMLRERAAAPWTAREDRKRVETILERVREVGGFSLVWS